MALRSDFVSLLTKMKGRVWAESEGEGKGSTFIVEFPLIATTTKK